VAWSILVSGLRGFRAAGRGFTEIHPLTYLIHNPYKIMNGIHPVDIQFFDDLSKDRIGQQVEYIGSILEITEDGLRFT
jgi:hypothetical protein